MCFLPTALFPQPLLPPPFLRGGRGGSGEGEQEPKLGCSLLSQAQAADRSPQAQPSAGWQSGGAEMGRAIALIGWFWRSHFILF
jgi:hypothetical protein